MFGSKAALKPNVEFFILLGIRGINGSNKVLQGTLEGNQLLKGTVEQTRRKRNKPGGGGGEDSALCCDIPEQNVNNGQVFGEVAAVFFPSPTLSAKRGSLLLKERGLILSTPSFITSVEITLLTGLFTISPPQ